MNTFVASTSMQVQSEASSTRVYLETGLKWSTPPVDQVTSKTFEQGVGFEHTMRGRAAFKFGEQKYVLMHNVDTNIRLNMADKDIKTVSRSKVIVARLSDLFFE